MAKKWFMGLVLLAALAVGILLAVNSAQPYMYEPGYAGSYTYSLLLNSGLGLMLAGTGLGVLGGAIVGLSQGKRARAAHKQGAGMLFDDWGIAFMALAGLVLLVTGILLGGTWSPRLVGTSQAIALTLNMHFIGIVLMLFGGFYTLTRMVVAGDYSLFAAFGDIFKPIRGKRQLTSYGWALWAFTLGFATLAIKGFFLVVVHLFHWPEAILVVASAIHDILALTAMLLAVVALVFLVLENLPQPKAAPTAAKA